MPAPRITLYSMGNCPHCQTMRRYLAARGLRYRELRIDTDRRAQKAFARLGARTVPVLMIGDQRVDGFDRKRLDRIVGKKPDC